MLPSMVHISYQTHLVFQKEGATGVGIVGNHLAFDSEMESEEKAKQKRARIPKPMTSCALKVRQGSSSDELN
jgi:hypothetical protein